MLFRCKRFLGFLPPFSRTSETPNPDDHIQQPQKCRAVCRPHRQASPAALRPAFPPPELQPRSGARRWVPRMEASPDIGRPGAPTTRWGADFLGPPGSPPPLPLAACLHHPEPLSPPPRHCAKSSPSLVCGEFRWASWPSLPGPERTAILGPPNLGEEPRPGGPVGSQIL